MTFTLHRQMSDVALVRSVFACLAIFWLVVGFAAWVLL